METPPAWALPLIVAALAVPIVAGFALGGPGVGLAVGALAIVALVVVAVRAKPRSAIETASAADDQRRILLVTTQDLDDPATVERIVAGAGLADAEAPAHVVVLVPAETGFLDRWASDRRAARDQAQKRLVLGAASLGKADVDVRARVGDPDVVLAVEDELRTFAATEVILVTGPAATDAPGERAATELRDRLTAPFTHVVTG